MSKFITPAFIRKKGDSDTQRAERRQEYKAWLNSDCTQDLITFMEKILSESILKEDKAEFPLTKFLFTHTKASEKGKRNLLRKLLSKLGK